MLSLEDQIKRIDVEQVTGYVFDKASRRLALAVNDITNKQHQLQLVDLNTHKKIVVFDSLSQQIGALALAKMVVGLHLRRAKTASYLMAAAISYRWSICSLAKSVPLSHPSGNLIATQV